MEILTPVSNSSEVVDTEVRAPGSFLAELYDRLDIGNRADKMSALNINTFVEMTDGTVDRIRYPDVQIKAYSAAGFETAIKLLNFEVIVCSDEILTRSTDDSISTILYIRPPGVAN
jgi:hypothetical protein